MCFSLFFLSSNLFNLVSVSGILAQLSECLWPVSQEDFLEDLCSGIMGNANEGIASLQTSLIVSTSLWQLQSSTALWVLALLVCFLVPGLFSTRYRSIFA